MSVSHVFALSERAAGQPANGYAYATYEPGEVSGPLGTKPDGKPESNAGGKPGAVYVLAAKSYQPVKQIGDLPLAWGIVTYPRSDGSIESH